MANDEPIQLHYPLNHNELPGWRYLGPASIGSVALHCFLLLLGCGITLVVREAPSPVLDTHAHFMTEVTSSHRDLPIHEIVEGPSESTAVMVAAVPNKPTDPGSTQVPANFDSVGIFFGPNKPGQWMLWTDDLHNGLEMFYLDFPVAMDLQPYEWCRVRVSGTVCMAGKNPSPRVSVQTMTLEPKRTKPYPVDVTPDGQCQDLAEAARHPVQIGESQ